MTACPDCGLPLARDAAGRTNLDPVSGRCIQCLARAAKVKAMPQLPRDWQKAAAGDVEDE